MNLAQVDWLACGKAAARDYTADDVPGLAAEMAYHFLFAIFPFLIFLAALTGFIGGTFGADRLFETIMSNLYGALPAPAAEALRQPLGDVLGTQSGSLLSVGALLALWSASNGVATVIKALNRAYGVQETRHFVVRGLLALGLTLVLSLLLIAGFVLLALGAQIEAWLTRGLGLGAWFGFSWHVVRLAGVAVGISLGLALLYWKGPNVRQQFRWITPGSAVATVTWMLGTLAFGVYVQFLGASSYSRTYGAAFGLILFLLYLYLTSAVVLVGAELNAEVARRYDPLTIKDKLSSPLKQVPGKQPPPHPQAAAEAGVSRRDVVATSAGSGSARS